MNADGLEKNQSRSCYNYYRFDYIHMQRIIISRNELGKTQSDGNSEAKKSFSLIAIEKK
jgi:hypothetical protein